MAEERTETIILDLQVDQGDALKQLGATEKAILSLKREQQELTKAYKDGIITEDDYIDQKIQLERSLKTETEQRTRLNKILSTENNSLDAQRLKLAQLTAERNRTNRSTQEGTKRFNELQKEILEVNKAITESEQAAGDFRRNVGNYPEALAPATGSMNTFATSVGEAAQQAQVGGTSIGDLGGKFTSFLNPATAVVGVLGGLVAILGRSRQAQELFGQATAAVSGSLDVLTRDLVDLTKSLADSGSDSGGAGSFFKKLLVDANPIVLALKGSIDLLDISTGGYVSTLKEAGQEAANFEKQLQALQITRLRDAGISKQLLRDAELLRQQRDDEERSAQERLELNEQLLAVEQKRSDVLTGNLQAEVNIIQAQINRIGRDNASLELLTREAELLNEIDDIREDSTGKQSEALNFERQILATIRERAQLEAANARATRRQEGGPESLTDDRGRSNLAQLEIDEEFRKAEVITDINKQLNDDLLKENKAFEARQLKFKEQAVEIAAELERKKLAATQEALGAAASLFEENSEAYKVLATADAGINTYKAANLALASYPPPFSYIAMAATIAAGIANIARINGIEFAEGGFTGPGHKYQVAGIVHRGEYVVPKHIVENPNYRGTLRNLESARVRGYADGGLVTNAISQPINQQIEIANIMKNLPSPVVSVREFTKVQQRVQVKENLTRISNRRI